MMYSSYVKLCYWNTFKSSVYYTNVEGALLLPCLQSANTSYFIPDGISCEKEGESTFAISVCYSYNTLFSVINTTDSVHSHFVGCTKNSLTYTYSDLGLHYNAGFRLSSLTAKDNSVTIDFVETDYENTSVTLNVESKQKLIIPIYATYTDSWNLNIEYFETYKNTPFALKKVYQTSVSVSDYDINALTLENIKTITGKTDLSVVGIVHPDETVKTEYVNASTYKAILSYGVGSLVQISYEGTKNEIRIPLTSYVDWVNAMGNPDWTILMLNTTENKYFSASNEVAREDLYGLFSVAVFNEQVSDLNYWFKDNTGDGCMTIFEYSEVKGDKVYKFFDNLRTKGVIASTTGHVGMAFCELVNDSNHINHSYFFYLDGSSDEAFISNGGASSADDTDSALENTVDKVGDKIGDLVDKVKDIFTIDEKERWTLIIGAVSVVGIIFLLRYLWVKIGGKKK